MGQMRFVIPRPERLVPGAAEQAYLAGPEGIPWECLTSQSGKSLTIERDTRESGYLHFPWNVPNRGVIQLSSGSLMERSRPYHLTVELARGTLNRLRNHAAGWQSAGMVIPPAYEPLEKRATALFARAATSQNAAELSSDLAEQAIAAGLEAIDFLAHEYVQQVLAIRRQQSGSLGTLLGGRLHAAPPLGDAAAQFLATFNTAVISLPWPEIEPQIGGFQWEATDRLIDWCLDNKLRVCLGPLVQMDRHSLPDWLFLDDDYDEVQASVLLLIERVTERYRGKVNLWHVAARMNQAGAFHFSEEQRLRLVVEAVDRVRGIDPRTPLFVSFDQPWAEYVAREDQELTPIHFADTLVRGELGLAGVGLELNYGYWPGGTLPRDPVEVSRQIDRWSQIGVPLIVFLSAPSGEGGDALARDSARPLAHLAPSGASIAWQAQTIEWLVPMLLAKPPVQAIVWDAWSDDQPHEMPHSGLYDAHGRAKPALRTLLELRRDVIGPDAE